MIAEKKQYLVTVQKKLVQSFTVTVQAESEGEACERAQDLADEADEDDWEFDGDYTDVEATPVKTPVKKG